MNQHGLNDNPELGGAGIKFLAALIVLMLIGHAGYNYVPIAYQAENFKQDMHTAVVQGSLVPSDRVKPEDAVRDRLGTAMRSNQLPASTMVEVKQVNNVVQARVSYSRDIPILPFGVYDYKYDFDHIATPTGFLTE